MIEKRNNGAVQFFALVLIGLLSFFIYFMVQDKSGKTINSASLSERVSYHYIHKDVNIAEERTVSIGQSNFEEGSANIVSSIVVNYRGFDTLGEILVLFAATAGVALLMRKRKRAKFREASPITITAVPLICFIAIIMGAVIMIHGHLTPGGGFPGGAVVASSFILMGLIVKKYIKKVPLLFIESLAGLAVLAIGYLGVYYQKAFLANFLPTGTIGNLFSSGTVAILYLLIGMKVAAEITSIGYYFINEED